MKRFRCCFFIGVLISLFTIPFSFAQEEDDATANASKDFTPIYHISDQVDLIPTLKFSYSRPRITVKSVFPQLEGDIQSIDNFNQLVNKLVEDEISDFKNQVTLSQAQIANTKLRNNLFIDFDSSVIKSNDSHILSFRFVFQGYIGGKKHPYHYHRVLNYDLENDEKIELSDLFRPGEDYLVVLSNYTRKALFKRLEDTEMILVGTGPHEENFRNWNIKPNGLLITFDDYQVAPSSNGAQTVLVPYAILKPLVSSDSPIAGCIKNRKKCARTNLLTGGFIDEVVNMRHRGLNPILSKR